MRPAGFHGAERLQRMGEYLNVVACVAEENLYHFTQRLGIIHHKNERGRLFVAWRRYGILRIHNVQCRGIGCISSSGWKGTCHEASTESIAKIFTRARLRFGKRSAACPKPQVISAQLPLRLERGL